ncbi:plasmid partitioning protein RepA [Devosia sp. BK]|uniref:plasmid partitioning protein RepA n=1 Tax=Devosia sp. BK TaxID=2871706 RepID=UPI00293A1E72|nr:plasmid partitioning protein RepA [Devosia sp. BK]MDV3253740.1 plasmid partitioning protein RepA [Devosia sp. BK]
MSISSFEFDDTILSQGAAISRRLHQLRTETFPPDAQKTLRKFTMGEVAHYLGMSQSNLKRLHIEKKGPEPEQASGGRRFYSIQQVQQLREFLDQDKAESARRYLPYRRRGEKLQVVAVVNFKGGSGKTTTAAHLSQHLALTGHRVLSVDLDPQASLTSLFGFQPEIDDNPSFYNALRYDDERMPLADVIRPTNFPTLDIVPANLDLQEFEYETPLAMQSGEGKRFYTRLGNSLAEIDDRYDVCVIDCPPQLGYLTLSALSASTSVLITVHPAMLDLMSMSQFLIMLGNLSRTVKAAGASFNIDWLRYLVTRFEPGDVPQTQMLGFMQSMLPREILSTPMVKSTAISDAGLTKQTIYEIEKGRFNRDTYDRAIECLDAVNFEIQGLIHKTWGRI